MWDNARLLNAVANALFAVALLGAVATAWRALERSDAFQLRTLVVRGELVNIDVDRLAVAVADGLPGNFFSADLAELRERLKAVPWVRRVEVRRLWPDRVEVALEEHVALARWGDRGMVNTFGEVFEAEQNGSLARLAGPAGSEREVATRYVAFRGALAAAGLVPSEVVLSNRFAWRLRVDTPAGQAFTVELGRERDKDPIAERVARFAAVYPATLGRLERPVGPVDLRYPNGFAVRVLELAGEAPARRDGAEGRI